MVQSSHGNLKSSNSAPHFRGDPHVFSKHRRESALAYSCGSGALRTQKAVFPEEMQGLIDQTGTACAWMKTSGQENFPRSPAFRRLSKPRTACP
jgi:hypothetical protein